MNHRRDVGRGTGGLDLAAQPIGVVSLVGQHNGVGAQMAEQMGGDRAVARLARGQDQFERQSAGVGQGVNSSSQAQRASGLATRSRWSNGIWSSCVMKIALASSLACGWP